MSGIDQKPIKVNVVPCTRLGMLVSCVKAWIKQNGSKGMSPLTESVDKLLMVEEMMQDSDADIRRTGVYLYDEMLSGRY